MFKLLVTSVISLNSPGRGVAVSVSTTSVAFDTKEEAETAYANINREIRPDTLDNQVATKYTVTKLY